MSAISAVAHVRPKLIERLFHKNNRSDLPKNGIYSMMFYSGFQPVIISIDNFVATRKNNARHPAFVGFSEGEAGQTEIWPMIIEKAYAKFKGNFNAIDGGFPEVALADLTGGIGGRYRF